MSDKLHHTKGIVLRTIKYGETSIIVSIYTELFGIQSYLVNGVRVVSKKGSSKSGMFQPAAILDMVVYHSDLKNLQRIKEYKWQVLYENIFSNIPRNAVALFMVELMIKSIKQPEANSDLYHFCEDAFIHLDKSNDAVMANFALYFALNFATFFGVTPEGLKGSYDENKLYFDLSEGTFSKEQPHHPHFIENKMAAVTAELLRVMQPAELEQIKLNHELRRKLLQAYETYYALHIQEFGTMKTLPVLRELLG